MKSRITLRRFFEAIKFKINSGGDYCWNCYGKDAFALDCIKENGTISIIYDTKNQVVYELSVCDYIKNEAYKWINPTFIKKYKKEMQERKIRVDQAWDEVNYQPTGAEKIINLTKIIARKK